MGAVKTLWQKYRSLTGKWQAAIAVGLVVLIGIALGGAEDKDKTRIVEASAEVTTTSTAEVAAPEATTVVAPTTAAPTTTTAKPTTTTAPLPPPTTEAPQPVESMGQSNARRKAADYLDFSAFSRSGLIEQLKFEGFSEPDAAYGVDALGVDWNEQAAKKAADYLEFSSFSHSGLVEQLEFEGFTPQQAEYGTSTTGL